MAARRLPVEAPIGFDACMEEYTINSWKVYGKREEWDTWVYCGLAAGKTLEACMEKADKLAFDTEQGVESTCACVGYGWKSFFGEG